MSHAGKSLESVCVPTWCTTAAWEVDASIAAAWEVDASIAAAWEVDATCESHHFLYGATPTNKTKDQSFLQKSALDNI